MARWIAAAQVADVPAGTCRELVVAERIVALFCVDGEFFALDGVCPHQGGPLGQGDLEGCVVTCPWHGWQFDVRTGQHQVHPNLVQPRLAVRIDGGTVYVDVGD
ncbi:MAG: Rieske 2Fe-2S domain-containing protein [Planctomycetaceae bacterium]|nr:Rieske 2Fe-2S domain-containing protein [Planctomycetaceae bacterium]